MMASDLSGDSVRETFGSLIDRMRQTTTGHALRDFNTEERQLLRQCIQSPGQFNGTAQLS